MPTPDGAPPGAEQARPGAPLCRDCGQRLLSDEIEAGVCSNCQDAPLADATSSTNGSGFWTHPALLRHRFPPKRWLVENVLPVGGLSVLGGKKKRGKSWLAIDLTLAVAEGRPWLGHPTNAGAVLYLALEDGAERVQQRLRALKAAENLPITWYCPEHGTGDPLRTLSDALSYHAGVVNSYPALVVLDTLAATYSADGRISDENSNVDMGALGNELRNLARTRSLHLMVVAHHGKLVSGQPGDDLRGASAISGSADVVLGLYRLENGYYLKGEGRDIAELELALNWDVGNTWAWSVSDDPSRSARTGAEAELIRALLTLGPSDANAIASALKIQRPTVLDTLRPLVDRGVVNRQEIRQGGSRRRVVYGLATDLPTLPTPPTNATQPTQPTDDP